MGSSAERPSEAGRRRVLRSLRGRLVVASVALITVVAAVIGTVTTIALHSYLQRQLDTQLTDVSHRAAGPPGLSEPPHREALDFLTRGGQPVGTVGAVVAEGADEVTKASVSVQRSEDSRPGGVTAKGLSAEQTDALDGLPRDGRAHTVSVPGLGDYRAMAVSGGSSGEELLVGLPSDSVDGTVDTLVVVEVCVTAGGVVAAGLAASGSVRLALRPLRRVARTATRVSELPLHHGEVQLRERVPEADTDPRTEVGQVAVALNRMLGHVGSALAARHESETRVRRFVADAGHELRTPLAAIRGYAELTRRGEEEIGPDTRHALGRIESESDRMSGLVEDLLLLARLDAGRPVERTTVDLVPLLVDAVSDARAAGPRHRWRLELPETPVEVDGEPARLQQVVANLLANARTHTPYGTTVTARLRPPHDGGGARIEIDDDGPGIPPETLPHVFERFARGDASRSRAHGSTGLGLAIVQAVVAAHGGAVSADSWPGRTVFRVELPG
ncbi:sensor histidine kinase [Streptomyces sulphureus]|uniref:sensor histidine kinase n=1 Tax=Streptomyces sulphureus TaxID=47758 RepID=UPI0003A4DEC5|nr:HAMP domain-containing sensor histidine kinase [Streptomyces sulphureus]